MRALLVVTTLGLMFGMARPAHAAWVQGTIQEIRFVTQTQTSSDTIVVWISATTGCTHNAFILTATDVFLKEIYATLLAAKVTGKPIWYEHIYCTASGFSRGNQYALTE